MVFEVFRVGAHLAFSVAVPHRLKQKDAARMIGISATTFSDLLHGRRALSFDIARSLHKVLGVPADIVLA